MSFYLRKSFKVGPVRFNLSKSGIGVSGGVKGLRVGAGPRGNYIHMGREGIYYRKTLGGSSRRKNDVSSSVPYQASQPNDGTSAPQVSEVSMTAIDSADVSQMAHSSSQELLRELNEKRSIPRFGPWILSSGAVLLILSLLMSFHPLAIILIVLGFGLGSYYAFQRDEMVKTSVLLYDFEPELEEAYANLHGAAMQLAQCAGAWHISAAGSVKDARYHAGATTLLERNETKIRLQAPPFLKTNIQTIAISVGRQTLYLFPDRVLVFDQGRVGAVGFDELSVTVEQSKCVEASPPSDAQVVGQTWQYVNKSGGPDKRFANNRQLPICLYDEIHFSSPSGLNETIAVSRAGVGQPFVSSLRHLAQYVGGVS